MSKKSLFLFGAAILGISSIASATCTNTYNPGPYIGIQGGWGLANEGSGMKDWFGDVFQAAQQDIQQQGTGNASESSTRGGIAGRALIGYSFIKYLSLEAGYTFFTNNTYDLNYNTPDLDTFDAHTKFKNYAVDLVGKAILPLNNALSIYGKLGVAYIHTNFYAYGSGSAPDGSEVSSVDTSWSSYRPAYGAGIAYNVNDSFAIDLSWTGIYGTNSLSQGDIPAMLEGEGKSPIPTTNLYTLGLSYKFANLF